MTPPPLDRYVASLEMEREGRDLAAALTLTRSGIDYGSKAPGSMALARLVMALPEWQGARTEANVASEIKAHCLAWIWLPPLRSAANPVDIECYQGWPANLWGSARRRLGRLFG